MKAKVIIEIKFSKCGLMRYISHLDLLRLFRRAASRAKIALELTRGFNPHPKISINRALKLGEESDALFCQFGLEAKMDTQEFASRLQQELPEGISIKQAKLI
ncbi:MAG: TIGR03936 family radical SAM-associated protein [Candidatus Omnitrophica bacterium]|nr:TIGR03936 family radical SAM-associated protein [Candidatus Omnitrophota bacterium]